MDLGGREDGGREGRMNGGVEGKNGRMNLMYRAT